jgi:hypothetical protein
MTINNGEGFQARFAEPQNKKKRKQTYTPKHQRTTCQRLPRYLSGLAAFSSLAGAKQQKQHSAKALKQEEVATYITPGYASTSSATAGAIEPLRDPHLSNYPVFHFPNNPITH